MNVRDKIPDTEYIESNPITTPRDAGKKKKKQVSGANDRRLQPLAGGNRTDKLRDLYREIRLPGSYSAIATTRRYSGQPQRKVIEFLSGIDGYSLHKPKRKILPRRVVYSKGIADLVQADLVELSHLAGLNDDHRFLLMAIDVLTKKKLGRYR